METARTLPRRSIHAHDERITMNDDQGNASELAMPPPQNAPRPMTLPTRGLANRKRQRILDLNGIHDDNDHKTATSPSCESPSYLLNTQSTFYKFPEKSQMTDSIPSHEDETSTTTNPVPLPPRDGKKHIKINAKRHVRMHPLIIPANGVQRTLNKVTERMCSSDNDVDKWSKNNNNNANVTNLQLIKVVAVHPVGSNISNNNENQLKNIQQNGNLVEKGKELKELANRPRKVEGNSVTYMNLDSIDKECRKGVDANPSNADTASLQFETIMEANYDKNIVLQSPDVTDGFYNFSIQKEHYNKSKVVDYDPVKISGLYVNEDELRNLDIERNIMLLTPPPPAVGGQQKTTVKKNLSEKKEEIKGTTNSEGIKYPNVSKADNELAGNALFNKIRRSVDLAMSKGAAAAPADITRANSPPDSNQKTAVIKTIPEKQQPSQQQTEAEYFAAAAARLADSNSVSCEDLLEFADQKPNGPERGFDSDEVRIMMKVLGSQCTTERCLASLDFIDWDVHKAIKLIKLQNILPTCDLSFAEAVEALKQYEWDLHTTALKLRGVKT